MSGKNEDFKSDDGGLQGLLSDVKDMQGILKSRISGLNQAVDQIESGWKGSAAGAYNQLQRRVNDYARKLDNHLQFIEEALQSSKKGFSANEVDQMETFKSLGAKSPINDL